MEVNNCAPTNRWLKSLLPPVVYKYSDIFLLTFPVTSVYPHVLDIETTQIITKNSLVYSIT